MRGFVGVSASAAHALPLPTVRLLTFPTAVGGECHDSPARPPVVEAPARGVKVAGGWNAPEPKPLPKPEGGAVGGVVGKLPPGTLVGGCPVAGGVVLGTDVPLPGCGVNVPPGAGVTVVPGASRGGRSAGARPLAPEGARVGGGGIVVPAGGMIVPRGMDGMVVAGGETVVLGAGTAGIAGVAGCAG